MGSDIVDVHITKTCTLPRITCNVWADDRAPGVWPEGQGLEFELSGRQCVLGLDDGGTEQVQAYQHRTVT